MVQRGQFLERPAIITTPWEDLVLEGLYHRGEKDPPVVIAPPHPMLGGSMDAPVCNEVAFACYKEDHPSLRFNYRGVGGSRGEISPDLGDAVSDYRSALHFLLESANAEKAVVAGYSYGAMAAAKVAMEKPEQVEAVILIAPPVARLDCAWMAGLEAEGLILAGEKDTYGSPRDVRTLFEHHTGLAVEIVPEADHFFSSGLGEVGRQIRLWLQNLDAARTDMIDLGG